jgi:hypothetical protein
VSDADRPAETRSSSGGDRLTPRETLLLYALSAARCAKCRRALVLESEISGKPFNIGKRAHIVGRSYEGARGEVALEPEDRGHLTNHLLLCGSCHDEVDADEEAWPVDRLRSLRAAHGAWIDERLSETPASADERVYAQLIQSACDLVGLDHWITWTEYMFDLYLSWRPEQMEDVAEFVRRIGATDWPGTLPDLECALKRLAQCLSEAAGTFSDRAEKRTHDLHVPRAYKRDWNPNYHRDAEAFERWVRDYETLLVEATRAADWARSAWRAAGHPMFMLEGRPQIVTSNNADDRLHFYVPEYPPDARQRLLDASDVKHVEPIPFYSDPTDEGTSASPSCRYI